MSRRERRRLDREKRAHGGAGKGQALLAAQALSRKELDVAVANWGGLAGATNFGPYVRTVTVTNRLDKRITIVAELRIFPAHDEDPRPYIGLASPELVTPDGTPVYAMAGFEAEMAAGVEWIRWDKQRLGTVTVLKRAELTDEQLATIHLAREGGSP